MEKRIENLLPLVEKPARYTGGELNAIYKENPLVRFVFAFPDTYEVGMSHLGLKILYEAINSRRDTHCERVFAPWTDFEALMRQEDIALYSLESKLPVQTADFLGFTLQYEMSYTNILNMLELSNLPLRAADRTDGPIVIGGGPCAFNPEPVAEFFDLFLIGDAEEAIHELLDVYAQSKDKGEDKGAFLQKACRIEGIYVPSFYEAQYDDEGRYTGTHPIVADVPVRVKKRVVTDLDAHKLTSMPLPYLSIIHDRIMLEIFRGCTRGCRFCQAGYIYRPVRERSLAVLLDTAKQLYEATGYEELSLSSLSTGDYPHLRDLIKSLIDELGKHRVSVSLPSLRIDSFLKEYVEELNRVRKTGLTFAPEAGTQRLRDVINKGVTEQDLLSSVTAAFEEGYSSVKLYFMMGLPTETDEDLDGIAHLVKKVGDCYYALPKQRRARGLSVTVSVSNFVPKPFTPFQWAAFGGIKQLLRKQQYLRERLKPLRYARFHYHDAQLSCLEAAFARGGREYARVLEAAHALGCKFDGWQECFDHTRWAEAFAQAGVTPDAACGAQDESSPLPWEVIDPLIERAYLLREKNRAYTGETTADCRGACQGCGMQQLCTEVN
ncbi:MAG: TIGR03960 family B12-binding radical SAM protein [Christensenellales bacterium]|jgi:radical SAM family uncharacterized protein